jgi:hypothetical protein
MPPDRPIPGSTGDWLTRAKADLAIARAPLPEGAFMKTFASTLNRLLKRL